MQHARCMAAARKRHRKVSGATGADTSPDSPDAETGPVARYIVSRDEAERRIAAAHSVLWILAGRETDTATRQATYLAADILMAVHSAWRSSDVASLRRPAAWASEQLQHPPVGTNRNSAVAQNRMLDVIRDALEKHAPGWSPMARGPTDPKFGPLAREIVIQLWNCAECRPILPPPARELAEEWDADVEKLIRRRFSDMQIEPVGIARDILKLAGMPAVEADRLFKSEATRDRSDKKSSG